MGRLFGNGWRVCVMRDKRLSQTIAWLREMDRLLYGPGLHLPTFAASQEIDEKTVRRNLKELRAAGCRLELFRGEGSRVMWRYQRSDPPLFWSTLQP